MRDNCGWGVEMTATKMVLLWVGALIALGGLYGYMTWRASASTCTCAMCRVSRDNPDVIYSMEPALALDTTLQPLNGKWVTPDGLGPELKGNVVLLDFWGTFCAPCITSIPANNRVYDKYASKGLIFAGISADSKIALGEFKKSVDVHYPLLASDHETFSNFKVEFTPSTFLFDRGGKLIWKGIHLENQDGTPIASLEKALVKALEAPGGSATPAPKKDQAPAEATAPAPKLGSPMIALDGDWLTAKGKAPGLKGNVVLLDFWGTFCGPCVQSIPANNKLLKEKGAEGLMIVGVATDSKAVVEDFIKKTTMNYPLIAGTKKTFENYGIEFLPSTFLYDRNGLLVWSGAQFEKENGTIEPEFQKALDAALTKK